MSIEKMVKPIRARGEGNFDWISRRDGYRIQTMEEQLANLSQRLKKLENEKRKK